MYTLEGGLYFTHTEEKEVHLKKGNRFDVISGKKHIAKVGENRCRYVVGEMIKRNS